MLDLNALSDAVRVVAGVFLVPGVGVLAIFSQRYPRQLKAGRHVA